MPRQRKKRSVDYVRGLNDMSLLSLLRNWKLLLDNEDRSGKMVPYLEESRTCRNYLFIKDGNVRFYSCQKRFCLACMNVSAYKRIIKYGASIARLAIENDFYFITLTFRSCLIYELNERLELMKLLVSKISRHWYKKKGVGLDLLCSLECHPSKINIKKMTRKLSRYNKSNFLYDYYNSLVKAGKRGDYKFHPHYHFLVLSKEQADYVVKKWFELLGKYSNPILVSKEHGVKSVKAEGVGFDKDGNFSLTMAIEMFKYVTKGVVSASVFDKINPEGSFLPSKSYSRAIFDMFSIIGGKMMFSVFGRFRKSNFRKESDDLYLEKVIGLFRGKEALKFSNNSGFKAIVSDLSYVCVVGNDCGKILSQSDNLNPVRSQPSFKKFVIDNLGALT